MSSVTTHGGYAVSRAFDADVRPVDHDQEDRARRERALAAAVVLIAVEDFLTPSKVSHEDHQHARLFLTSDGAWGESRRIWCEMAGIDGDVLRERAIAGKLRLAAANAPKPKPAPKPKRSKEERSRLRRSVLAAAGIDWRTVHAPQKRQRRQWVNHGARKDAPAKPARPPKVDIHAARHAVLTNAGLDLTCTTAEATAAFAAAGFKISADTTGAWLWMQRKAAGIVRKPKPRAAPKPLREPRPTKAKHRLALLRAAGLDPLTCSTAEAMRALETAGEPLTFDAASGLLGTFRRSLPADQRPPVRKGPALAPLTTARLAALAEHGLELATVSPADARAAFELAGCSTGTVKAAIDWLSYQKAKAKRCAGSPS